MNNLPNITITEHINYSFRMVDKVTKGTELVLKELKIVYSTNQGWITVYNINPQKIQFFLSLINR